MKTFKRKRVGQTDLFRIKPFKNLPLGNRQTDFHETWYVASGTLSDYSLFKQWPWSELDLFYGKIKFCNLGFSLGKSGFFKNVCLVLGIRTSVGVLALPFRQTKPFQPSCHSRKSILGSFFTVLNACFSFKLRITVWSQSMHV